MSKQIQISDDLYDRLAALAQGFDTPADVIEKLLGNVSMAGAPATKISRPGPAESHHETDSRDFSKYLFKGQTFGKGRLALAIVSSYARENSELTSDDLAKVFPDHLQGSHGVFRGLNEALSLYDQEKRKRYFIENHEIIELADGLIAVCNQWGILNIDNLIKAAGELGFQIEKAKRANRGSPEG